MIVGAKLDSVEDEGTNLSEDCGNVFVIRWNGFIAFVFFLDEGDVLEDLGVGEDGGLGFDDLGKKCISIGMGVSGMGVSSHTFIGRIDLRRSQAKVFDLS